MTGMVEGVRGDQVAIVGRQLDQVIREVDPATASVALLFCWLALTKGSTLTALQPAELNEFAHWFSLEASTVLSELVYAKVEASR